MKQILLVAPRFAEFALRREFANLSVQRSMVDSLMVPLHLATVAALTPDEFEVDLWDEGARGEITEETNLGKDYDLVGVTAYIDQIPRALQLAAMFRSRGTMVTMGGPGVSGSPEHCRSAFDVLFLGEAELTWPRFLQEWKKGHHRPEYRQVERPDLSLSPVPRWDSVAADIPRYRLAGVQTTRGCPFDCDFCDVIHLFGRQPRHKPIDSVIAEVVELEKLGAKRVFFCDDDFSGDHKYARQLLRELIPVNNAFQTPLSYNTQLTINVAQDDELLELLADANFTQLLVGVETPRAASLAEANKTQNLRSDLVTDCKKIQSYGIAIKAGLMVGFDADDQDIFDEQMKFIREANITITNINTLKAYPGTPLWVRLQLQERIIDVSEFYAEAPKAVTNVIPKQMTIAELLEGYGELLKNAAAWEGFKQRAIGFVNGVTRKPNVPPPSEASRQSRMGQAMGFINSLSPDVRGPITEIFMYTMQHAPYLAEKVGGLTMQHFMDTLLTPYRLGIIQKEIDWALAGKLKPERDPSAGLIPKGFHTTVKEVMPTIHDRLAGEMRYLPGVPEAVVSVLKDFLIRWGSTFQKFEEFHLVYIQELCDRHIERWNRRYADIREALQENQLTLSVEQAKSAKFIREALVAVEQEMRGETRIRKDPPLIPLSVPATEDKAA